jgi:hypothetical protein
LPVFNTVSWYTGIAPSMLLFISTLSSLYSRFLNGPMFLQNKKEYKIENNVHDSSLGVCDEVDPTYNSIKSCQVNNDTTYDHTSNIVQRQVNSDTTYDHTF